MRIDAICVLIFALRRHMTLIDYIRLHNSYSTLSNPDDDDRLVFGEPAEFLG